MAATEYTLTDSAWTDLGVTPLYVEITDAREAIIAVGTSSPSAASKVGTRLSFTPPRDFYANVTFADQHVYAKAEAGTAKVLVQSAG